MKDESDLIRLHGDPYEVLERLTPRAFKVRHRHSRQLRVIRTRHAGEKGEAGQRGLRAEAKILEKASKGNKNLPRVFDLWSDRRTGTEYLVLEWIDGVPLQAHTEARRRSKDRGMLPEDARRLLTGVAFALRLLHQCGYYHGDIKPANILVAQGPRSVLIDFGSAWNGAQSFRTQSQGTMQYRSPEQVRGERADHRSDQFSASVVLYELLTGVRPYEDLGGEVVSYASHGPLPPLVPVRKLAPEVWSSLELVVQRGLALDPAKRYPTSDAWLDDLRKAQGTSRQQQERLWAIDRLVTGWITWIRDRFRSTS